MEELPNVAGWIPPAWVLVALIGALWTGISTVVVPPRTSQFSGILLGAIVGAAAGQLAGASLSRPVLMVGDVHVVVASLGALLALGVVRHFSA